MVCRYVIYYLFTDNKPLKPTKHARFTSGYSKKSCNVDKCLT